MDIKKTLVRMKVSDLVPYERNPRKIPKEAIDDVCESYRQCGVIDPIEIDEDNVILSGHTRRLAALEIGIDKVDCLRVQGLTDDQKRKYRVLANKTGERSTWDADLLAWELEDLDFEGYDFDFDLPELNAVLGTEESEEADDYEPNVPDEPKAKRGQIYQLGKHRLMCGDSTDLNGVNKLLEGRKADLLLTDPPYGIDYGGMLKGKGDGKGGADKNGWKSYDAPSWDKERPESNAFANMLTLAEQAIIWGGNYFADVLPPKMCWLVWDKGQRDFSLADGELAWTSFDKALRIKTYSRASANREDKVHPTQKPIELLKWCIEDIADRNMGNVKTVLDLYGGSGSTLITCEMLNRKCYMCELEPHYVDVIIDRWEQYTGEKAVLLNG